MARKQYRQMQRPNLIHTTPALIASPLEKAETCERIIRHLPNWFGIESANHKYIGDASIFPALSIKHNNTNIALLIFKNLHDTILGRNVINIHWLGVMPDYHRCGLGKCLLDAVTDIAKIQDVMFLTVETLNPAAQNPYYLKTFKFYDRFGFKTYDHFNYGEQSPMVKLAMPIL